MSDVKISDLPDGTVASGSYVPCVVGGVTSKTTAHAIAALLSLPTFPAGTIVGNSDSQTLTNKTIAGASNTLTVRIASDVSGLGSGVATFLGTPSGANLASALSSALPSSKGGTGLTALGTGLQYLRTNSGATAMEWATLPVMPSGTIVGDTDSQTLTNKTIAGASNTLTVRIANDVTGLGSGVATFLGTPSGANLASALSSALPDSKGGTGLTALASGIATWLGTPSGANLASALTSALPDTKGGTGLTALATGIATFLGTPSGANLAAALTSALPDTKGGTGLAALGTGVATFLGTPSGANLASALSSALPVSKGGTNRTALGTGSQVLRTNAGATDTEWATLSGGTPGGSDTHVQFDDGGVFGGNAAFTFNKATGLVTAGALRIPNAALLTSRNVAGNGDIAIATVDASDDLYLGDAVSSGATIVQASGSGAVGLYAGGSSLVTGTNGGRLFDVNSGVTTDLTVVSQALAADFTCATSASGGSTNLTFAVLDGEVWIVEFRGTISCSSTGGVKFAYIGPTGSLCEGDIHGELGTGLNTYGSIRVTDSSTPTYVGAFAAVAATLEGVWGMARIKMNGAGGTITIGCRPVTNTQTATLKAGFWMRARRATEV